MHCLINNAGVMLAEGPTMTEDGFEVTIGTNTFLLCIPTPPAAALLRLLNGKTLLDSSPLHADLVLPTH